MRKIFSVPLNPKLNPEQYSEFLSFLSQYKDYIRDVYFTSRIKPFVQDAMGDVFLLEEYHFSAIEAALNIQQTLGISVSATFNNIEIPATQQNLDLFIKNFKPLYDAGIRSATIPHTHWMATGQIKAAFPELYVKNTILREVHTAQEVVNLANYGFDYINLDRDMMRDHALLRTIKKAKAYIKETTGRDIAISLLGNEGCLGGCSMMVEHFQFNNNRSGDTPQYFNDPISRTSCKKWEVEDPAVFLKTANFPPWKEDWDQFIDELGIDSIKMHGREAITRLYETMDIIKNYAEGKDILFQGFENYLQETNLTEKPINIWREKIKTCQFECWSCQYCDKIYDKKSKLVYSELVQHTAQCISDSGIPTMRLDIPGLTSPRVQTLLNSLAKGVNTYLEVGAAMGATFCAAIKGNPIHAIAVDNWKEQIQPARNDLNQLPRNSVQTFIENVKKHKGLAEVDILNGDLFKADVSQFSNNIEMFFYDGPHDFESTKRAVEHYYPVLANECIIVFDDANWQSVVEGAQAGINSVGAQVTFEKMMLNSLENPNEWWNGLYIVVIRKND
jgi:predicted O-methyltransferase YrrM